MNIRGWFKKSILIFALLGLVLGGTTAAFARSGGGIDLKKAANNYSIVTQIQAETGMLFTGMMFVVDNSNPLSRDATNAGSFKRPFDTIDYAIGRAGATASSSTSPVANNGTLILILPGHTNTAMSSADEIDADTAGLVFWGGGTGADKPTLTYTTTAGEFTIGANSIVIGNIRFISSFPDVLKAINVEASVTYPKIINCEFLVDNAGTDEFTNAIAFFGTNTGALVEDCLIDMGIGNAASGILYDNVIARGVIRNNVIRGDYSVGCIEGNTALSTNILIEDNLLVNGVGGNINGQPAIELLTGTTGVIRNNSIVANLNIMRQSIVADTCLLFENYYNEDVGTFTGALIGTPSADD